MVAACGRNVEDGEGSNRRPLELSARVDGFNRQPGYLEASRNWRRLFLGDLGEALLCFLQYQEVQHPKAPHRG